LEALAAAGGAEFNNVDLRNQFRRSEHSFRREPVWLSLPERQWRSFVDEAEKRAERDRGGVLAAELITQSGVSGLESHPYPDLPPSRGKAQEKIRLRELRITVAQNLRGLRNNRDAENTRSRKLLPLRRKVAKFEGEDKILTNDFIRFFRPLRPLRPFGVAQDMLCGRYSELWLRLCRAGSFVVKII
jgi:hypothetical protein